METITIRSREHDEMINVTSEVQAKVSVSGVRDGVVDLFVPHTTAGITLSESMRTGVEGDILADLDRLIPWKQSYYKHREGNSAAHLKTCIVGSGLRLILEAGELCLGSWQGIFLCEFDGPRTRKIHMQWSN